MTRTQECRSKLVWIEENCPLDRTSIIPIRKASELCEKYVEISTMSTDAIQPLTKIKDVDIQKRTIATLSAMIVEGKKPKRKDVEKAVNDAVMAPRREELVRLAKTAADNPMITLCHGDFLKEYANIPAGSIDCIITDPPYVNEWINNFSAFGKAAKHVLKPDGFLIMYIGHIHLDRVMAQMTPHLNYFWIMALEHDGTRAAVHGHKVQCTMKPILIFSNSPQAQPKRYFGDLIKGSGREKGAHPWQQGEGELKGIFEPFTDPNDLILDPFMGSGTVLAMAKKMNRRAIGFDINADNVAYTKGRLSEGVTV